MSADTRAGRGPYVAYSGGDGCTEAIPAWTRVTGRLDMTLPQAILVLDDEPNFCRILEAKLTKASFEVVTASDAVSAFRELLARRFDLILLDLRLPDANGLDLMPRIRAVAPTTPVLIMTAYEVEGLRERALRAGAIDVLYKPFDLNVLTTTVRKLVEVDAPLQRPTPLLGDTLSVGRAVVIQMLSDSQPAPRAATVLDEKADTFAVTTAAPLEADAGAPVLVSITGADALYEFRSKVVEHSAPALLSLIKPAVIHRHQRRKHPRRLFQRPVEVRRADHATGGDVQSEAATQSIRGISIDLGAGGLCVALPEPLAPGSAVSVSFTASDENPRPFRADATVIRSEPVNGNQGARAHKVGLQFTDIPAPYRPLLKALLDNTPQN